MSSPLLPPTPGFAGRSLFLDFDGTLVEIAAHPDAVSVGEALLDRIARLAAALPGRIAIVSGRSIAQLDAMLGAHAGMVAVAGSHGAERRLAGEAPQLAAPPASLAAAAAALADFAGARGLVFERKTLGAAVHYRTAPDAADAVAAFVAGTAEVHGLTLQRGKMMVEVRASGDKGAALAALMAGPAMAGTRPLMFGDDVTDEDGFVAAAALGGAGVLVGPPRATAARHRLADPAALLGWIDAGLAIEDANTRGKAA